MDRNPNYQQQKNVNQQAPERKFSDKINFVSKQCILQCSKTERNKILFQIALACGTVENNGKSLPKFDYSSQIYFGFSETESADLVRTIKKFLMMPGKINKVFYHKSGNDPKTIVFDFDLDQKGQPQARISVSCDNGQNRRAAMFLKEYDLEIIKENLKTNYIL